MLRSTKVGRIGGLLLCMLLVSSLAAAPAAASEHPAEEFLVELDSEGNADVAVTYTYDLETDSEQAAFEELRTNESAQEERVTRLRNRMGSVAAAAANTTGREMSIEDASIDVSTTNGGDTGVVVLSVTWNSLAVVEGDRLVMTEPFASGFEPNRSFTVQWPDGYGAGDVAPAPATSTETSVTWDAGTELEGFSLTVTEPSANSGSSPTDGTGAGFGVIAVLAALAAVLLTTRRP